jgi:chaperonin GroEL
MADHVARPARLGLPVVISESWYEAAVGKLKDDNPDIQAGINIVFRALEAPVRQIVENAGVEGSVVVGKINENKSETYGFDAQTEQYVDMLSAGIVDPAKVVRVALQDAARSRVL